MMEMLTLNGMVHRIEFHPSVTRANTPGAALSIRTWDGLNETHVLVYDDQVDEVIEWLTALRSSRLPT